MIGETLFVFISSVVVRKEKKSSALCVFLESQVIRCLMMMIFIHVVRVAMWLYFHGATKIEDIPTTGTWLLSSSASCFFHADECHVLFPLFYFEVVFLFFLLAPPLSAFPILKIHYVRSKVVLHYEMSAFLVVVVKVEKGEKEEGFCCGVSSVFRVQRPQPQPQLRRCT